MTRLVFFMGIPVADEGAPAAARGDRVLGRPAEVVRGRAGRGARIIGSNPSKCLGKRCELCLSFASAPAAARYWKPPGAARSSNARWKRLRYGSGYPAGIAGSEDRKSTRL